MKVSLDNAYEFIENRLFYMPLRQKPQKQKGIAFFSIDEELVYWNFYNDFGPLNTGQTFRFCQIVQELLSDTKLKNKKIVYYSGVTPQQRANAATLISCFAMVYLNQNPAQAFSPFRDMSFPVWQDASPYESTYPLHVQDVLEGFHKALKLGFVDFNNFDVAEYEHFERVENGDLTWLSRGANVKNFIAFAGPKNVRKDSGDGYLTLTPEDYIPYFKQNNVTLVIRLNRKCYDAKRFECAGIKHLDLIYPDGSNAPERIIRRFLQACDANEGAIAVHCKAGLGRTGTLIGAYMMREYGFTSKEVIGYLRLARPGMIIGPQQDYMDYLEPLMRQVSKHSSKPNLSSQTFRYQYKSNSKQTSQIGYFKGTASQYEEKDDDGYTQGDLLRQARNMHFAR